MTDFLVERIKAVEILAAVDGIEALQAAIQEAAEALTKQAGSTPVNAQVFDDTQAEYTSAEIDCSGYRKFLLRVRLAVTAAPTNIQVNVQFSQGGATYETLMNGPFGSLMYEDTAGAKNECIEGECLGAKMKINVVATGVSDVNKFTLTCKVVLTR
jgi:hypothetical protein